MRYTELKCTRCSKSFSRASSEVARSERVGRKPYCSLSCASRSRPPLKPNVTCALCGMFFHKRLSSKKNSKSGLFFCCRAHKDRAQRIGGIREIMPPHYGTAMAASKYRKIAFSHYEPRCTRCGYDRYKSVLHVHHKDRDRTNLDLLNLEVLCPTCHMEEHLLARDGLYAENRVRER